MSMGVKIGKGIEMGQAERRALARARELCNYGQQLAAAVDPNCGDATSAAWCNAFEALDILCDEFPVKEKAASTK